MINAGCIEAATISGMLAAESILKGNEEQLPVPIIGRAIDEEAKSHEPSV